MLKLYKLPDGNIYLHTAACAVIITICDRTEGQ